MRAQGEVSVLEGWATIIDSKNPAKKRAVLLFKGNTAPVEMMWRGDEGTITALLESDYPLLQIVPVGEFNAEIDFMKNFGTNSDSPDHELDEEEKQDHVRKMLELEQELGT